MTIPMTMHKKRWIIVVLVIIVLILTIVYSVLPVTFRPSVSRKLTPRVISINGIPTGSFYYYGGSYPANLTIVVEVTWNDWKPVRGAGVTIYGSAGGTDTNTTDLNGLAVLHLPYLPKNKPRHLMGVGSAEDIIRGIKMGIDIFDSAFPTRNARHGTIFTDKGRINLGRAKVKGDVIQEGCECYTCRNFSLDYLNHLFKEKDPLGPRLATIHNLFFTNKIVEEAREKIKEKYLV